ncbi:hypothetical protein VOLCADRAFT_93286 [Volvox carteri f. nagariensis]|uniref:von Hippel-Lindau disease tumour suppressor beta domain-containing protein n=1 Tax=Volvox carteri f. nagariensis TaxID=3068 RepID=D8U1Q8_VOLCA|nr:uncharacterized protein VOLCADRAFT_93286 [Volvox carteri f. nagariensis]EFJ46383.1 hypothetical protein VOLCADRAFT_93286 [Volvox carteri f. nagariensis]|eukprot:XP_002952536.1 hypothetical protein VOLCADRAFT_93286 [Volvox carteri f. nagariensis]
MAPEAEDAGGTLAPAATAAQLNAAAAVGATLSKDVHQMEWNGLVSENMFHLFVNSTEEPLELSWGDDLRDNPHSTVAPYGTAYLGTYNFHTWRVRSKSRGIIATYTASGRTGGAVAAAAVPPGSGGTRNDIAGSTSAAAATTAVVAGGCQVSEPGFRQRSSVLGMPIWAFDCVSDAAVSRLVHVVGAVLSHSPAPLLERLVAGGASFAVFGKGQVVTDVPAHRFMRYNSGRNLDSSARGLGATPSVPVTSCAEENLTMQGDCWYPCQSILIHEVGHMVHNIGLTLVGEMGVEGVLEAYRAAMKDSNFAVSDFGRPPAVHFRLSCTIPFAPH